MFSQVAILVTLLLLLVAEISSAAAMPAKACSNATCGNLSIPFPFGTTSDCSLDDSFLITCDHNYNPPKPFLNSGTVEILDISLEQGLIRIASSVASDCYDDSGLQINGTISELALSRFLISSARNKFVAVGCDTYALVEGSDEWKQMSAGCVSWCNSIESVTNGTCSGIGCCQTSIPKGVKDFLVDIRSFRNHKRVKSFNPCGYAFVVEDQAFAFSSLDLRDFRNIKTVPVVLDWSIGNVSCREAQMNLSTFACRSIDSECSDFNGGIGYLCRCLTGFQGNPYLHDGCQDVNECDALKPCEGTCNNTQGSYLCSCPKGFEGDGKKDGDGCHPKSRTSSSTLFYIASGFMVPAVGSSWIFWRRKQKKVANLRRNTFLRNGGRLLEQMQSGRPTLEIFTADDLKRTTNNYDENNILHAEMGFGVAYRGTLPDGTNRIVTVIKCYELEDHEIEIFMSKLVSLSQINHRNVVKLLGCCLETHVPLLVYEFVTVGTLYDYIYIVRPHSLSWDIRLRIATEIAGALSYIHSATPVPVIHGNVNTSNILLYNTYSVKIRGFTLGVSQVRMAHVGIIRHLDPEYFHSDQLTVKSDVYSFGVVLAELLMGNNKRPELSPGIEEGIASYFVNSFKGDSLLKILDSKLDLETQSRIDQLTQVAIIADRCLSNSSLDRPTMKEVVIALENATSRNSSSTNISPNTSKVTTTRRVVRRNRSF